MFVSACATARSGSGQVSLTDQILESNEPCRFSVDGREVAAGRRVVVGIAEVPHTITCSAEGYRNKTEHVNPPYGRHPYSFFFMVEDRLGAAPSWDEVHARERVRETSQGVRAANYSELAGLAGVALSPAIGSKVTVVAGFVNRDTGKSTRLSARLEDEIVAGLISRGVKVVKRDGIEVLLKEMRMQEESGVIDSTSGVSLGRILGARKVVTGNYVDAPGEGVVKVRVQLIDLESGVIEKAMTGELLRSAEVLQLVEN